MQGAMAGTEHSQMKCSDRTGSVSSLAALDKYAALRSCVLLQVLNSARDTSFRHQRMVLIFGGSSGVCNICCYEYSMRV